MGEGEEVAEDGEVDMVVMEVMEVIIHVLEEEEHIGMFEADWFQFSSNLFLLFSVTYHILAT